MADLKILPVVVRPALNVGRALPAIMPFGGQCPPYTERFSLVGPVGSALADAFSGTFRGKPGQISRHPRDACAKADPTHKVSRTTMHIAHCLFVLALAFALGAGKPPTTMKSNTDDAQALLAERDKAKGARFPGKDPAFLVLPRPAERNQTAKELLTPQVLDTTEKALAYLARTQDADGGWSDGRYPSNTGVTALACLAFMSEGSRPRIGRFGKQLDAGLTFLLNNVKKGSGVIAGKGNNPFGPMYEHAFATLALLFAYGDMPWRPEIREVLSDAVEAIKKSQKQDGGWRYEMSNQGASDMSVTANVLWVLRTAKKCGFTVPQESIEKGVKYVEECAQPDGTFRYRTWGLEASPSLGGTGIIGLLNHGKLDHPLIPRARDRIMYDYRRHTIEDLKARRYLVYGVFYASVAIYPCGDEYWVPWFKRATEILAATQRKDGEFRDEGDNSVYATAMAAMVLQAPRGYLPVYER